MPALPAAVTRWRERLVGLVAWAAFAAFTIIFAVNIVQIAARPFGGGWVWVHDLSALLFAWTVMLGAAAAYGKFDHVVASFLVERLSSAGRRMLAYLVRLIELVVAFLLLVAGLQIADTRMNIAFIQLGIPTGWAYLAVPALGAFMLIFGLTAPPHATTTAEQLDEEVGRLGPDSALPEGNR